MWRGKDSLYPRNSKARGMAEVARGGYLTHLLGSSREAQRQKVRLHCESGARLRPWEKWLTAPKSSSRQWESWERRQDETEGCTEQYRDKSSVLMDSQWVVVVTECQESWAWSWGSLERETGDLYWCCGPECCGEQRGLLQGKLPFQLAGVIARSGPKKKSCCSFSPYLEFQVKSLPTGASI